MKAAVIVAAIALVQAGLASAIPQKNHDRFHKPRKLIPETETLTTTFYQTVVWVDNNGAPVSTEINSPPPDASFAHSSVADPIPVAPSATANLDIPVAATVQTLHNLPMDPFTRPQAVPLPSSAPTALVSSTSAPPAPVPAASTPAPPSQAVALPTASSAPADIKGSTSSPSTLGGMGICYDLIAADSACKSPSQMSSDFSYLKSQGYGIVRTYDIGCDLAKVRDAASGAGLSLIVGLNSIANLQADLAKLVAFMNGNWASVDTVYIGNELVNSGQASADVVAGAVNAARGILKSAGYNANVVTVDTFAVMQSNPTICSTSDYCAANAHAFFDPNTAASGAGTFVLNAYNAVKAANGGKRVVITESGWPYKGGCNGKACPGVAEQKAAMNGIMSSFAGNAASVFLFMAYDASYKAPGAFGVEPYFGIYDQDHYAGGIGSS